MQPVLQYNLAGMDPAGEEPLKHPPVIARISIRYNDLDPYGHVNNASYLEFFEEIRLAYWRALADLTGFDELEAGDVPGARYVIAETTVRYKAPIFLDDALHGAASVPPSATALTPWISSSVPARPSRRASSSPRASPPTPSSTPIQTR